MTPAETLLAERLDDLRCLGGEGSPPANVKSVVEHLIDAAWEALYHDDTECTDIIGAGARIEEAIKLLQAYRERLSRLYEIDGEEFLLAAGGTKDERGDWAMPEGWLVAAPPAAVGAATGSAKRSMLVDLP